MKIEKLTDNKIRVIINTEDLNEIDIDFNLFMNKSTKTQNLFFEILEKAEEELDFHTDGYKLLIEAFSSSDDVLIFTITKFLPKETKSNSELPKRKKVSVRRKSINLSTKQAIYSFNTFEEFCDFCVYISNTKWFSSSELSKNISLYLFNDTYYLVIKNINTSYKYIKLFYSIISEFGKLHVSSKNFENKLLEYGNLIMKKDAIATGIKYFCH